MEATTIFLDPPSSSTATAAAGKPSRSRRAKFSWPGCPSSRQKFSLPPSIIYYIARNPSTRFCYKKLTRACKYFFEQFPLLLATRLHVNKYGSIVCAQSYESCYRQDLPRCCMEIVDLTKYAAGIWINHTLAMKKHSHIPLILQKLYHQSKFWKLSLGRMTILYDDYKYLASTVQSLELSRTNIIYNDGSPVPLDKILEAASPRLKKFQFIFSSSRCDVFSDSTFSDISKLPNFKNIKTFTLYNIPFDLCNVEDFCAFVKAHKSVAFYLQFDYEDDLPEEYMSQLDACIDNIIETGVEDQIILYYGQNKEKGEIMKRRYPGLGCLQIA